MNFLIKNRFNILILALVMIFLGISSSLILNINSTISNPIEKDYSLYNVLLSDISNNIEEVNEYSIITGKEPNNYVWYSGKLWRAVSVNNNDNTTKLVTDDAVVTLSSADNIDYFLNDTSNNGFLGNLNNYKDYIKTDAGWYKYNDNRTLGSINKSKSYDQVINSVGLLTTYDYQLSYDGTTKSIGNSYLNNNTNWATYTYDNDKNMIIDKNGKVSSLDKKMTSLIRPSINILSNIRVKQGLGTKDDPYFIDEYIEEDRQLLNKRYSGEYVKYNNELYRIINKEDKKTKLVATNLIDNKKFSNKNSKFDIKDTNNIGYYLNDTWYNKLSDKDKSLLTEGKFYIDKLDYNTSYKELVKGKFITSKVGLLRYGEMFSISEDKDYFLITPYNNQYNRVIYTDSLSNAVGYSTKLSMKIALYINENAYIIDGDGTSNHPFIIDIN